jgi:molybdate transport system substrate-binding protein
MIGKHLKRALALTLAAVMASSSMMAFAAGKEVTISAAASLQEPLDVLVEKYEARHKDTDITVNYGAAGALQLQIENGAPVDMFIPAAQEQMDALKWKGLLINSSRINLLGNRLVLIVPVSNKTLKTMSGVAGSAIKRVALGEPSSVPAGKYAVEYLTKKGLLKTVANKAVYGNTVRAVLQYVATGNADAGFVYKTDALSDSRVRIVATASSKKHTKIVYPAALVRSLNSINNDAPKSFLKYLKSDTAKVVFKDYGFSYLYKK